MRLTLKVSGYIVLLCIVCLIGIPLCIYSMHKLYLNKLDQFFIKRRIKIIWLFLILITIDISFGMLIDCILNILDIKYTYIIDLFQRNCLFGIELLIIFRVYILYYDHCYSHEIQKKEWSSLMTNESDTYNWFELNKIKYGNTNYLYKLFFIVWIIISLIYDTLYLVPFHVDMNIFNNLRLHWFYTVIITVIFIGIVGYLWRKYPSEYDLYGIRKELKQLIIVWFIGLLLILCIIIVVIGINITSDIIFIIDAVILIVYLLTLFNSVIYVILLRNQQNSIHNNKKYTDLLDLNLSWYDICNNIHGYQTFMLFLLKEFSFENLLFLTEYYQFRTAIIKYFGKDYMDENITFNTDFKVPNEIPQSILVQNFIHNINSNASSLLNMSELMTSQENIIHDTTKFKIVAFQIITTEIYSKYLDTDSMYQINISAKTQYKLMPLCSKNKRRQTIINKLNKMGSQDIQDFFDIKHDNAYSETDQFKKRINLIMPLFEKCAQEISKLIGDSFQRFVVTKQGRKIYKKIGKKARASSRASSVHSIST